MFAVATVALTRRLSFQTELSRAGASEAEVDQLADEIFAPAKAVMNVLEAVAEMNPAIKVRFRGIRRTRTDPLISVPRRSSL